MSLNLEKNITRSIWNTIPMPDTAISCINELACNKPNRFIFTDRSGHPIGDINITEVDRNAAYSNGNQDPQDLPRKFQTTEEAEEDPSILDTNIDFKINHKTPT